MLERFFDMTGFEGNSAGELRLTTEGIWPKSGVCKLISLIGDELRVDAEVEGTADTLGLNVRHELVRRRLRMRINRTLDSRSYTGRRRTSDRLRR